MRGLAGALGRDATQRRADGISGEQGSEEHGGAQDGTDQRAQVRVPVVSDAAQKVTGDVHGRASVDEPAVGEAVGTVEAAGQAGIVGDDHERDMGRLLRAEKQVGDALAGGRVE